MAMTVLMKQTRQGDAGAVLSAGSTYTVTEALGAQLVGNGFATDVNGALQPDIDFDVSAKVNRVTGGISYSPDNTTYVSKVGNFVSSVSGQTPTGLKTFRTALQGCRAGTGKARIVFVGDSTTYGYVTTNYETDNTPQLVTEMLNAFVAPTYMGIIYATGNIAGTGAAKRSYANKGTGWGTAVGYNIAGVGTLQGAASAVGTLDIGPFNCNGFIVYWMRRATTSTFNLTIDAETPLATGGAGADLLMATTVTAAAFGAHTLHIGTIGAGATGALIVGVEPIIGTSPGTGIYVSNAGAVGSRSLDWNNATAAYASFNVTWDVPQPHLTVIDIGINDIGSNYLPATFQTNLTSIVTKAQTYGSVLLVIPHERTDATFTYPWAQYVAAINAVSLANAVPVLSVPNLIGGTIATADGGAYDSGDHIHMNTKGYYLKARAIFQAITTG